ncbi:hypothetical protein Cci01nite_83080 [Catellatospora citrea]|uniref:4Fe-4S Wbl-type domain-containing protein n=1 Tax=Catellatospora citrea TaxID=53366 RepID=A0A8J3KLI6_9ACTN|nr:hypothetical protein Cci01nite_83080 [Catellatospora citrea]
MDTDWWSDARGMWPQAVARCIGCPVRQACFADAVAHGDVGVVRGGAWFAMSRNRPRITPLVCQRCGARPVCFNRHSVSRMCAPCSDGSRRAHPATEGRADAIPVGTGAGS